MAENEQDNEDDFTVAQIDEEQKRATVNVEATWQEYDEAVEFQFTAGEAKIQVTVPYDAGHLAQILVASLPQAFETAVEAYFDRLDDTPEEEETDAAQSVTPPA